MNSRQRAVYIRRRPNIGTPFFVRGSFRPAELTDNGTAAEAQGGPNRAGISSSLTNCFLEGWLRFIRTQRNRVRRKPFSDLFEQAKHWYEVFRIVRKAKAGKRIALPKNLQLIVFDMPITDFVESNHSWFHVRTVADS